jgi:hypothetical protein
MHFIKAIWGKIPGYIDDFGGLNATHASGLGGGGRLFFI